MPVECKASRDMSRSTISGEDRTRKEMVKKRQKASSVRILVKRKSSMSQHHDEGQKKVVIYSTIKIYFAQAFVYIL